MTFDQGAGISDNRIVWLDQIFSSRIRRQGHVPPLCELLRYGTRNIQQRRESMLSRLDLSHPHRYQTFLRGEGEALFPLEAALARCGIEDVLPDWQDRARSFALKRDLLALDTICDPLPSPHLEGLPELLGVCYALEVMRMGARIVLCHLASLEHSEIATMAATSYLHSSAHKAPGPLTEALESHPEGRAHPGRALHAAQMTFGMFESAHGSLMSTSSIDDARLSYSN